jgi:hypothetical protein
MGVMMAAAGALAGLGCSDIGSAQSDGVEAVRSELKLCGGPQFYYPCPTTLTSIVSIAAAYDRSYAVTSGGFVYHWGKNYDGVGNLIPRPVLIPGLSGVVSVAAGSDYQNDYACVRFGDGSVKCWQERSGLPPATIALPAPATQLTMGRGDYGCALMPTVSSHAGTLTGVVSCWGSNHVPAIVATGQQQLSRTCAAGNGDVTCWGNGTTQQLIGMPGSVRAFNGFHDYFGIDAAGTVRGWGSNFFGELGDGTVTGKSYPVIVSGWASAVAMDLGYGTTCAILGNGTVRCSGNNENGELGDGTVVSKTSPVTVAGLSGAVQIALGEEHTCSLLTSGNVMCWGDNRVGQVGDGLVVNPIVDRRTTPVFVANP